MFTSVIDRLANTRRRGAAIGAAVVLAVGAGGVAITSATGSSTPSTFTPITPCRLMDTRPGPNNVGPRNTPLAGGTPYTAQVTGTNGNCTIPTTATAVNLNVTSVAPSANGFLTVWPSDQTKPLSSSLNWVAGQAPTPNSVTVALSTTGQVSFQASAGTVNLIADVTGYYEPATGGAQGPAGPAGPTGPTGPIGPQGTPGTGLVGSSCTVNSVTGVVQYNASNGLLQCIGGVMGNGVRELAEECDDANVANGDGCSATGKVEPPMRTSTSGAINNVTVTPSAWVFMGPTKQMNARVGRALYGAGSASIGLTTGTALIDFTLCYQIGAGPVVIFLGNYYVTFKITGTQQSVSAAAQSPVIPAQPSGLPYVNVKVGVCASASVNPAGTVVLDYNDYSSFWVSETD